MEYLGCEWWIPDPVEPPPPPPDDDGDEEDVIEETPFKMML